MLILSTLCGQQGGSNASNSASRRLLPLSGLSILALVILVADDEHASHYEEIVKLHQSIKRSVHNWKSLWHNGKDGQETIQRPSASLSLAKDVAEMTPSQQKTVLEQLKQEEMKLMAMLPKQGNPRRVEEDILAEEPELPQFSARTVTDTPHDWSEGSSRVVDEEEYLPEDDEALMKQLVEEQEEEKRREKKHQRQIELDEEEMERATAETLREKVLQEQRRRKQAAAKVVEVQETRAKAAKTAAANVAAANAAAAVNAKNRAARVEQQVMEHVKHGMFDEQMTDPARAQARETSATGSTQDLLTLKPADDPEITRMRAQLAGLQATLKADKAESKAAAGPSKTTSEEPAIAEAVDDQKTADAVHSKMDGHEEIMQAEESDDLAQPDALQKKLGDLISVEAPQMKTTHAESKASEAVPVFDTPVDTPDSAISDDAVDALAGKDLADKISKDQEDADSTEEKEIEADEDIETTSSEADYNIVYYLLWVSVGALAVGLCGSLMYCVFQGPRDRPWGMPPKRQYS